MGQVAVPGGPWLLEPLALLMLVVAVASTARITALVAAGRSRQAGFASATVIDDAALALMAVATAGMLGPGLRTLPDTAWEVVFAALTTWFAVRSARAARAAHSAAVSPAAVSCGSGRRARALAAPSCAPHLAHCAAMLYMFLALPAAPGAGGGEPGGVAMAGMASPAGPAMSGQSPLYHVLAVLGALVVVGYCARDVGHLSSRRYRLRGARAAPVALLLSQASRVGCRAVMGVTMAVMLVIMT